MKFGYSETCLAHDTGARHPETPDRLRAIQRGLQRHHGVSYVDAGPADRDVVEAVHDPDYVASVESFCADGGGEWDADTIASRETFEAALVSAGLSVWAAERALDGDDGRETPFALGRPPGHHAVADDAMGFCFFNNAAVAAAGASRREDADRVAVFDWDVHHGNGTQALFAGEDDRFYASIHERGLYPGTGGSAETDGETLVNAPVSAGAGDADYCRLVDGVIAPAVERFDPDLLLISAGFDAHRHDPISRTRLSTEGYALLTDRVRTLAADVDAALGFILEGGYGLDTLSEGINAVHETFDGREPVTPEGEPDVETEELVDDLRSRHRLAGN